MPELDTPEQIDSYLNEIESTPTHDIPMKGEAAPEADAPGTPANTIEEWELKVNGQAIKAPRDKVIQWAQMGYDAPKRIGELNQKLQGYQTKESEWKTLEEKYQPYREIDDYMSKNPDFWKHVTESWQTKAKGADAAQPAHPELAAIKNEFGEIKNFLNELKTEKQAQAVVKEDESLDQEVRSIREQYTNIDFDQKDAEGKSLEYRILEHATKSGIGSFKTAFADFYLPNLLKQAEERGKETQVKDVQRRNKLGLLGVSSTPKTAPPQKSIREKTYNDIEREILDELKSG